MIQMKKCYLVYHALWGVLFLRSNAFWAHFLVLFKRIPIYGSVGYLLSQQLEQRKPFPRLAKSDVFFLQARQAIALRDQQKQKLQEAVPKLSKSRSVAMPPKAQAVAMVLRVIVFTAWDYTLGK